MLPILLGVGLVLTLPPSPLGVLAPLPLLWLLFRGGFRAGFWAGLGFWALHLLWLPQSFVQLFDTPLGALPFVPLVLLKALSWGLLFWLTRRRPLARAGGWVVLEYLSSLGDLAFPWGFLGYALTDAPGRTLAALGGVYLLSLAVLLTAYGANRLWGLALRREGYSWPLGALSLLVFGWLMLWGWRLPPSPPAPLTALLVQGSVNPLQKLQGFSAEDRYRELTRSGLARHPQAGLVVWPETAVRRLEGGLVPLLAGRTLLSGVSVFDGGYRNRVVLSEAGQVRAAYDKARLVPFGEFFPWRGALGGVYDFFFRAFGFGTLLDTAAGDGQIPLSTFGAYICYESVFPASARGLVRGGAWVLVNVSNDAWFGPSLGGLQHFQMGRLRAVENGRWLLRAGNDGITAVIDPYGRVTARLAKGRPGFLAASYGIEMRQTAYTRWGDWAVGLALGLALLGARGYRGTPATRPAPSASRHAAAPTLPDRN